MTYSAALFEDESETLRDGQSRKINRLLSATDVTAGSRVLEIGTGGVSWQYVPLDAVHM